MTVRIIQGDAMDELRKQPSESAHCIVTSPPYWGLRDYGTGKWDGGDPACEHRVGGQVEDGKAPGAITTGQRPGVDASVCRTCGAHRLDQQLGLESTPAEYVEKLVAVFHEGRRVLRDDGTLWLNLGDSYNSIGHKKSNSGYGSTGLAGGIAQEHTPLRRENTDPALKHKDLCMIPARVAIALQADGWYLRQDIIWSKPNPMPESVRDRCTKAHEYLFLLAKSERYYFDAEALQEPAGGWNGSSFTDARDIATKPGLGMRPRKRPDGLSTEDEKRGEHGYTSCGIGETRNKRSVWTVTTQPFREAHFATFPPKLIEPCILAGCPEGGTVLDPFGGAGTTGLVSDRLKRHAILIELNPEYAEMARKRIKGDSPLFAEVA